MRHAIAAYLRACGYEVIEAAAQAAAGIRDKGPHLARPYDPQGVADHVRQLLAIRDSAMG